MQKGPIYRNPNLKPNQPLLENLYPDVVTLADILPRSRKLYAKKNCYGTRKLIKMWKKKVKVGGVEKEFEFPEKSNTVTWTTVEQAADQVDYIATNIAEYSGLKKGDKVGVYLDTCPEWMLTANAAFRQGLSVVTCYANLGFEALIHVIGQCELTTIVCPPENVSKLEKVAKDIPTLKKLIVVGGEAKSDVFEVKTFSQIIQKPSGDVVEPAKVDREDIAVIMYTSGSTGMPKGVLLTHRNVVAGCSAVSKACNLNKTDTYICYLPLAHIFELATEWAFLMVGGELCYGSPRTLSGKGVGPLDKPETERVGDILCFKPTLMCGVPRVWDTIKKGIDELVANGSFLKRYLMKTAFAAKKKAIYKGQTTPWWDALIFSKIAAKFGGRLRLVVSGGAPLSKETHEFLKSVFVGAAVIQGCGLTENTAATFVQCTDPSDFQPREAGRIVECAEIMLRDIPEMGYTSKDKPFPRGEILMRGPCLTQGYYKLEDVTKKVFDEDGWFHTGDVGLYDTKRNAMRIIDRIKNICKLLHGEYIAFEELEMTYSTCPFVAPNGLCIYADSTRNFAVGLVVLNAPYVKRWAAENKVTVDMNNLHKDPKIKAAVLKGINAIGKSKNKKKWELLKDVAIMEHEFTPDDGTLTASFKLQRRVIYADRGGCRHDDEGVVYFEKGSVLEQMYGTGN